MPTPRHLVVDNSCAGFYHCIARCVRRAFLCGDGLDHRRDWIRDRLRELAATFAIDVCGYTVMGNHLHVVLWTDPERAQRWSRREVACRWLRLFPGSMSGDLSSRGFERAARRLASDVDRIATLRGRLSDISWFMRCLCEPVARRANQEDECSGRFWEGRFKCHRLLDEAAVLACLVYVDLNVIRAKLARTPEESDHTSVQDRIVVRQHVQRQGARAMKPPKQVASLVPHLPQGHMPRHEEEGIWLAPIDARSTRKRNGGRRGLLGITLDQYLALVDVMGRVVRSREQGSIPEKLQPILRRLDIDCDRLQRFMRDPARLIGTAMGSAASLACEAARRGKKWVVGALPIY